MFEPKSKIVQEDYTASGVQEDCTSDRGAALPTCERDPHSHGAIVPASTPRLDFQHAHPHGAIVPASTPRLDFQHRFVQ